MLNSKVAAEKARTEKAKNKNSKLCQKMQRQEPIKY